MQDASYEWRFDWKSVVVRPVRFAKAPVGAELSEQQWLRAVAQPSDCRPMRVSCALGGFQLDRWVIAT